MQQPNRPYKRKDRVSELIHRELGALIQREMELGALMTIMSVELTDKLDYARVYVSVLPTDKSEEVLKKLNRAAKSLEYLLLRKLNIKPLPSLEFKLDTGSENAAKVEKALLENEKENEL